jgi:hypothetical protein
MVSARAVAAEGPDAVAELLELELELELELLICWPIIPIWDGHYVFQLNSGFGLAKCGRHKFLHRIRAIWKSTRINSCHYKKQE